MKALYADPYVENRHGVLEYILGGKAEAWNHKDMETDHVTAWSKGCASDATNCEMLCTTHNRMKGNK